MNFHVVSLPHTQTTTAFGRAFLALADQAAFKATLTSASAAMLDAEDQALTGGVRDLGSHRGYWASRNVARQAAGVTETATYGGSGTHLLLNAAIWT